MLRITGGEFRGRFLKTPQGLSTRPTQARLRQALFNSIQMLTPGAKILDLFAGSGALGFESLSRGATHVTFVEDSKPAIKLIEENARELKVLDQIEIIADSVDRVDQGIRSGILQRILKKGPFDIALADPPYEGGWELKLLSWPWQEILGESGHLCLEWGNQKSQVQSLPDQVSCLVKVREKNYGDSVLTTYSKKYKESELTMSDQKT